MKISIIVPVLNEAERIVANLQALQSLRGQGHEVILADGGSGDETIELGQSMVDRVVMSSKGRARQMNAGAAAAGGDVFLFLHADTLLPDGLEREIEKAMSGHSWGRFDVSLSGRGWPFRIIETMMNLRSRYTRVATGDQALFVRRQLFTVLGGFDDIPLMEDVAFSKTLRRHGKPWCSRLRVTTSSRRWEKHGVWRTILLMWRLRLAYFLGVSPHELVKRYYVS